MKNTFKFRAECLYDVNAALKKVPCSKFKIECNFLPDCTAEIETSYTLEQVKESLKRIIDGHVMLETIAPIAKYTGERN